VPLPRKFMIFYLKMVWYGAFWVCFFKIHVFNCWIKNCTLGALQLKMTATCGIQKFRWREKIKHLSKYWGSSTQNGPCRSNIGGSRPLQPLRRWRLCLSKDDSDFPCFERRYRPIRRYIAAITHTEWTTRGGLQWTYPVHFCQSTFLSFIQIRRVL